MVKPIYFASPQQWREWLAEHHDSENECVVGFVRAATGTPQPLSNSDAVDQALCFGWIDGVVRRVDDGHWAKRFTPRKPGSNWSNVNVAKVERLRAAGVMTEAGERAFAERREDRTGVYSFEQAEASLDDDEAQRFRDTPGAWEFFQAQAPSYRRVATHWVTSAKRDETRERRLATLIADSAEGRRLRHLSRDRRQ